MFLRRGYRVLAIESLCDDACVALLERTPGRVRIVAHEKRTLDLAAAGGVIPQQALRHHTLLLPVLALEVIRQHGLCEHPPLLVVATRGPGMPGPLSAGTTLAKGLAMAWNRPYVGAHHMLGHLLTPRMPLDGTTPPAFPYLLILVSGGHTMLVHLKSLLEHRVVCDTIDNVAIGDSLDKCARELGFRGVMIGRAAAEFIDEQPADWLLHEDPAAGAIDMALPKPLRNMRGRVDVPHFSYAPFLGAVRRALGKHVYRQEFTSVGKPEGTAMVQALPESIRRNMAFQVQEAHFEHLLDKVELAMRDPAVAAVPTLVLSGGVAANARLRQLVHKRWPQLVLCVPPPQWCTDNAAMIGWCGVELHEAGILSDYSVVPQHRWSLELLQF